MTALSCLGGVVSLFKEETEEGASGGFLFLLHVCVYLEPSCSWEG